MKDDRVYLEHVRDALGRIERYTAGGEQHFLAETLIQDAVLRNLQTLAESTQRISEDRKLRHPSVDWRAISGFRNVIVHNYLGISAARVWQVVTADLPSLQATIEGMLAELDDLS
jgi:uncharacterized protein with HEPN domain